ncbi:MAG TPA: hypothetical protein VFR09_04445 [Alphaproteobacteria bacterium]|nr:hypothetical protein [Alphaproteobacteria bacterium]
MFYQTLSEHNKPANAFVASHASELPLTLDARQHNLLSAPFQLSVGAQAYYDALDLTALAASVRLHPRQETKTAKMDKIFTIRKDQFPWFEEIATSALPDAPGRADFVQNLKTVTELQRERVGNVDVRARISLENETFIHKDSGWRGLWQAATSEELANAQEGKISTTIFLDDSIHTRMIQSPRPTMAQVDPALAWQAAPFSLFFMAGGDSATPRLHTRPELLPGATPRFLMLTHSS